MKFFTFWGYTKKLPHVMVSGIGNKKVSMEKFPLSDETATHWFTPSLLLSILLFNSVISESFAFNYWTPLSMSLIYFSEHLSLFKDTLIWYATYDAYSCIFRLNMECKCSDLWQRKTFCWKNDGPGFYQDEKWWMQDSTTSLGLQPYGQKVNNQ